MAQGNKEADKWIVAKLCFQFLCWFFRQNNYPGMVRRCQSPIWLDSYTTTCEALYDFFNSEFLSVRMDAFPRFNEEVFLRLFNSTTQLKCNKQPVIKTIFLRMLLREAPPQKIPVLFGNYKMHLINFTQNLDLVLGFDCPTHPHLGTFVLKNSGW